MTLSSKIGFLRILHLFAVGLHTCTAVARSLCVSWAFLLLSLRKTELVRVLVAFNSFSFHSLIITFSYSHFSLTLSGLKPVYFAPFPTFLESQLIESKQL